MIRHTSSPSGAVCGTAVISGSIGLVHAGQRLSETVQSLRAIGQRIRAIGQCLRVFRLRLPSAVSRFSLLACRSTSKAVPSLRPHHIVEGCARSHNSFPGAAGWP